MATLEILHWNDVHARFEGLARLSARAREIRASAPHPVLLLDGGDVEDTSVRLSAMTFGVAGWRLLGAAGVDAAVAGNGGMLRYGPGILPRYAEALGTSPLVCDLEDVDGNTPAGAAASVLLEAGDLRVGVVGITDYYAQYDTFGLRERGRTTAVRREADALRGKGADVVVLLSHAGLNHDRGLSWSLRGKVDLVVGGHTHHLLTEGERDQGLPIAQAGWQAEHLGRILLDVSRGGVEVVDMRLERVEDDDAEDPLVLEELARCERDLATRMAEKVGHLDDAAPHTGGPEDPAAQLVAAALLDLAPADLAVLIGGQVTHGLPAGDVTRHDVWSATSSPGNLATATLTGAQLRVMFERGRSAAFATTRPRTFRGRPYGYLHAAGATVHDGTVLVGGLPLEPTRRYRVTATDLELSPYGTLVDEDPADLDVRVPAILPELLEDWFASR